MSNSVLAGETVYVKIDRDGGGEQVYSYHVEDYWDVIAHDTWLNCASNGNIACVNYALRAAHKGLPWDNKVLYGKIDGLGYLVHISEIVDND